MQTGRRAGPPPPAPRGDGPAPKESLRRARARARPQGTVIARRPSVLVGAGRWNSAGGLGSFGSFGVWVEHQGDGVRCWHTKSTEIRRGGRGAHVEDRGGGAFSTSGGSGAAGDGEQVNQLVLNRDQRLCGRDPFIGRGGGVLGNVPEVTGNAPQAENHLSRQGGPSNRDHRSRAALSPAQALRAHFGSVFVKRRHDRLCAAK